MDKIDTAIIGAGVVGLSVAAEMADGKKSVFVLDKEPSFGQHTSSRNSEVIHAGIYYQPGSLKARLCIEGNALLYEIAKNALIPYKKISKIIVATNVHEIDELEQLFSNAKESGAAGLELLSKRQIQQLEPNVNAQAGIFSPNTGILDTHLLMKYFINKAQAGGVEFSYNSEVVGIKKQGAGYLVTVLDSDRQEFSFISQTVVNSAGLFSDKIAAMAGVDINAQGYILKYCKGQYFRIGPKYKGLVNRLVYPVPKPHGRSLGIHTVLDLAGNMRLGPDEHYLDKNIIDYNIDESCKQFFFESVSRFLPAIQLSDFYPDVAGIRPKLQGENDGFRDFIIKDEKASGLEGFINLIGIESPGLTASSAIAKMVKGMIR